MKLLIPDEWIYPWGRMTDNDFRPFGYAQGDMVVGHAANTYTKATLGTTCPAIPDLAGFTYALV